jgi:outer membrane receptor protein involved in Fe transport
MRPIYYAILLPLSAIANPAYAQNETPTAPQGAKRQFRADFFAAFSPVNAQDMVERIPGFSINSGDGRRGFGDNAGNVLIDGDRPSTKSDDIFAILSRIPASQVDYIELTEQSGADSEARGQGQIVNVVRKGGGALSGTYEARLELGERRGVTPFGNASASIKRGKTTFELSAGYFAQFNSFSGTEIERNGQGRLTGRRFEDGKNLFTETNVTGAIKTRQGDFKINLNGKVVREQAREDRVTNLFGVSGSAFALEQLKSRSPSPRMIYEIGGDVEFPVVNWLTTKLIGLYRTEGNKGRSQVDTVRPGQPIQNFNTRFNNRPRETIARIQNDLNIFKSHAIQFGGEVAFNSLNAQFAAQSTAGGAVTQFPASNVLVKETRFEPFISDVWSVSTAWKIEGGVIAEKSRITVSGDSSARRSFLFWKPRLAATWTVDKLTTVELRAERQVAQLDFNDFATSVDLGAAGQVAAGNADLVPEKTNTYSALIRRKFFERGSIQLLGSYVDVSDTQDLVPIIVRDNNGNITSRFDGAGNIGNSTRWNAELEITLPFDWITKSIGITGMELKYIGHYHDSRVTDPVTGRNRRRSQVPIWHQDFNFRHDIAKAGISWGVDTSVSAGNTEFFIDQIRKFKAGAEIFSFIEYKKFKIGTLRFQVGNVTDVNLTRTRTFFRDTRASGDIIRTFNRNRSRDTRFQLSLAGKF